MLIPSRSSGRIAAAKAPAVTSPSPLTSAAARRWSWTASGMPSATIRTIRMYAKAITRRVRTFVVASYASSGARNRNPTPRIVVM